MTVLLFGIPIFFGARVAFTVLFEREVDLTHDAIWAVSMALAFGLIAALTKAAE